MSFYDEMAAVSLSLLTEFGQSVTHRAYTTGTYDVATGTATPATTDATRTGALFDINTTTVRGQLVQVADKQLLVDGSAAINLRDRFVVGGVEYAIVSLGEINPAGTRVMYDLHVRVG